MGFVELPGGFLVLPSEVVVVRNVPDSYHSVEVYLRSGDRLYLEGGLTARDILQKLSLL